MHVFTNAICAMASASQASRAGTRSVAASCVGGWLPADGAGHSSGSTFPQAEESKRLPANKLPQRSEKRSESGNPCANVDCRDCIVGNHAIAVRP
ncbi:hypothetical protein AKJ09_04263 [Labilithrix luteola]|uniref:Uncharacterized protein n=1 Tax=Labilithrix luteola TaxID=1391654 RepID=A0A0K1PWT6_9BACT|nr:hypothetical protein AKJ09_04263 [Labilithrix luteola]